MENRNVDATKMTTHLGPKGSQKSNALLKISESSESVVKDKRVTNKPNAPKTSEHIATLPHCHRR